MEPSFFILQEPKPGSPQDKVHGTRGMPADGFNTGPARSCSGCGRFLSGLRWLPPYCVELETWGTEFGDVMHWGEDLIVSERFKGTYLDGKLTGLIDFEPIEVIKVKRHRKIAGDLPRYFKAAVIWSETTVDRSASGAEWEGDQEECAACLMRKGTFLRQKQVVIRPETWTGHDIFHARGGTTFVASKRMKETCDSNGITNAVWVPANEYEVDFYPSEPKLIRRYLRVWEDENEDSAAREDAYRILVFAITHNRMSRGRFDPNQDVDSSVIAAAKALAATVE